MHLLQLLFCDVGDCMIKVVELTGYVRTSKNRKKYFRLIMIRVALIVEKNGFQKNFEKF